MTKAIYDEGYVGVKSFLHVRGALYTQEDTCRIYVLCIRYCLRATALRLVLLRVYLPKRTLTHCISRGIRLVERICVTLKCHALIK